METKQPAKSTNNHKTTYVTLLVVLLLLLATATSYGILSWRQAQDLSRRASEAEGRVTSLVEQNRRLNQEAAENDSAKAPASTIATEREDNKVVLPSLGVSLTVPDSLKDITIAEKSVGNSMAVELSTNTITDMDAACSAEGNAPPLGRLLKTPGRYLAGNASGALVKQFETFYVAIRQPQAPCSSDSAVEATIRQLRKDFGGSLESLQEIR